MPSIPSVPLISASPSLASSSTGVSPAAASASAAGTSAPDGVAHRPLAHQRQRAVGQRGQVSGATERPVLVHHRGDAGRDQGGHQLRRLRAYAGVAGRQRRQAQQHQRPHHLALDLGPGARSVRAHQRALQLGAHLGGDVPGGERPEPRRDAVRRRGRRRELLDHRSRGGHRGHRLCGQLHGCALTGDRDDVDERDGAGADRYGVLHAPIQRPDTARRPAGVLSRGVGGKTNQGRLQGARFDRCANRDSSTPPNWVRLAQFGAPRGHRCMSPPRKAPQHASHHSHLDRLGARRYHLGSRRRVHLQCL